MSRTWRASSASGDATGSDAAPGPGPGPALETGTPRDVPAVILAAARASLLEVGYARLSTRRLAEAAGVPLSQIHYHFGSKQQLILRLLAAENEQLLERQTTMFAGPEPLSVRWDQACAYLEADLASGYVRVLQEMVAAGFSDPTLAGAIRGLLGRWFGLLVDVARQTAERQGSLGPFTAEELGTLMALPFVGAESMLLLGFQESEFPVRAALRKIGVVIRAFEGHGSQPARTAPD